MGCESLHYRWTEIFSWRFKRHIHNPIHKVSISTVWRNFIAYQTKDSHIHTLSKPFTYALALEQLGAETVQKHVGREPSGRIFNEIAVDYDGVIIISIYITKLHPRATS